MHEELDTLENTFARFDASIRRWIGALEKYEYPRLIHQPDPESWSIGQVYVHLIEETGYYFQQCRYCLSGTVTTGGEMNEEGKKLFRMDGFPHEKLIGPANVYNVAQPVDKEVLREGMMELKRQANALCERIKSANAGGKTEHPGLGWFGAADWYRFAEMHLRHHFRQMERIDKSIEETIPPGREKLLYDALEEINRRPAPFSRYTANELWTYEHTSEKMLQYHLDGEVDLSSRRKVFIDASVEWITSRFKVNSKTRIADFGCGPGLYTRRFAEKGAQVTGIDFSSRSLNYAKEAAAIEGLRIHYIHKNYLEWETDEKFDLVLMIMCDFSVLSPQQRSLLLRKFRKMLNTGGAVLLDVYSMAAFRKRREEAIYGMNLMDNFWAKEKYYGFLNTFRYEQEKVILDKYTIITMEKIRTIYNWFQYFEVEDLKEEFVSAGFAITGLLGDVAGNAYSPDADEFAVIAE